MRLMQIHVLVGLRGDQMVVIRLSRGGTNKRPFYKIIVTDKRKPRDSGYIERLGFYNPIAVGGEEKLKINQESLAHWLKCGAKPSPRVEHLIELYKSLGTEAGKTPKKRKSAKNSAAKTEESVAQENVVVTEPEASNVTA